MKIGKLHISFVPRQPIKWYPYRLTLAHNPAIYRFLLWNYMWR
jgi:hypothetical protein